MDLPRALPASSADTEPVGAPLLCLLGRPLIRAGARSVELSPKDAALMALAALAAPMRPERAAALLWPEAAAGRGATSLRQRIHRLRRDTGHRLLTGGAAFALEPDVTLDTAAAVESVGGGRLWPVPELLGDLAFDALPEFAQWLLAQRREWRETCRAALGQCADRLEHEGALAEAAAIAQRLVEADPLLEHGQRRLMRLHYLRGDRAAAVAAFERFERALKDELGLRPSAETQELLATIERADRASHRLRPAVPVGLLRPPRFIGREHELRRCDAAWSGDRAFVVRGEAGVGKSRLLREFQSDQAGAVLVQARPGDESVPYALAARLLHAVFERWGAPQDADQRRALAWLLPEWGEAAQASGEAQRLLIQRAFGDALGAAATQGLGGVLLDDLHFADDASLGLVKLIARGDAASGLLLGMARRPAEAVTAMDDLQQDLVETQRLELIDLGPLGEAQMVELVASLGLAGVDAASLGAALYRHTGGNPLFALETLKERVVAGGHGDEHLPRPASIGVLVERRLAALSPEAQRLARAAALAGTDFSAELAAAVLDAHPLDLAEPWRELEAAQVIRDGAFAHDLIFEATRRSVPQPIARLLHRRIATLLSERGAAPARVAAHWQGAEEWPACGASFVAAARQARAASQRTHEAECWRGAALAFDAAGDATAAFDARCESVPAMIVARGVAEAQRVVEDLLASAYDDRTRAAALTARANAALMAADHATGIAAATQAAALVAHDPAPLAGFEPARLLAVGYTLAGRAQEALAVIEPFEADIERFGSTEQRGHFWADYAYVLNGLRRLRDTGRALEQAMVHARTMGDIAELATMTSNLATVKGNLGQGEAALQLAQRALALQTQLGALDGPSGAVVQTYVGLYSGALGRYREALLHLDTALDVFRRDGQATWIAVAAHHKAQWLIDLGQVARARQALDYDAPSVDSVRARGATIAARIARLLGQGRDALACVRRAVTELGPGADPNVRMHVMLEDLPQGDPEAALARCDEVLALARRLEFAGVATKAQLLRVRCLVEAGRQGEAAAEARLAVAQIDAAPPADFYLGEAWWIVARAFDGAGDADDALMALSRGARWVRREALPHVPEAFVDSFVHRNPSNRALLAAADRRLAAQ